MGDIGPEKLILIVIVLLLLFGARRIPEIAQSLGKGIRTFKQSLGGDDVPHDLPRELRARTAERERLPEARDVEPRQSAEPERREPKRLS